MSNLHDPGNAWTDERVALLRKLWAEGLAARDIAAALGGGITKNAAIGKAHRIGLEGRRRMAPRALTPRPPKPKPAPRPALPPLPPRAFAEPRTVARAASSFSSTGPVRFMRASAHACRWPLDDEPSATMLVCGAPIAGDTTCPAYCAHHAKLAKNPVQPPKRRLRL